jgi:hypothetical protein
MKYSKKHKAYQSIEHIEKTMRNHEAYHGTKSRTYKSICGRVNQEESINESHILIQGVTNHPTQKGTMIYTINVNQQEIIGIDTNMVAMKAGTDFVWTSYRK